MRQCLSSPRTARMPKTRKTGSSGSRSRDPGEEGQRYLENFVTFLPPGKRAKATLLLKKLMDMPNVKIEKSVVKVGRKKRGHLLPVLMAIFQPEMHALSEANVGFFKEAAKGIKSPRRRKGTSGQSGRVKYGGKIIKLK